MRWGTAILCASPLILACMLIMSAVRENSYEHKLRAAAQAKAVDASASSPSASSPAGAEPVDWGDIDDDGLVEMDWLQILPADELEQLRRGSIINHVGARSMLQVGSRRIVPAVLGRQIKLPGYVVPLETDEAGRVSEFFLVPFYGACIHVPPPPPNQMVFVRLKRPLIVPDIWEVYWIKGELSDLVTETPSADAAYFMADATLVPYDE